MRGKQMPYKKLLVLILFIIFFTTHSLMAADYIQIPGLIDTRTTHSDGALDVASLAQLAKARGFDALFFNDHDRLVMEYGLFPFRNIIKKRVELNSINKGGADKYLNAVNRAKEQYPDLILIPGSETVSFYYWTGSYFKKNLTANYHEKRILTIGMENAEDYKNLPIIHNGFSTRYVKNFIPEIFLFFVVFIISLLLIMGRGLFRIFGIVIGVLSMLFMINTHSFRSSPFDQYHGDQGLAPYQLLIDYVNSKGGLTFWNYPETRSGIRKLGPIFLNTPPYPEVLEKSKDYTGFAALYGDNITVTEPGHEWDRVLLEYCKGERERPVWGISTADFHKDGEAGEILGNFPTVFLVRNKTKNDVISAIREGRMYACRGKYPQQIVLNEFSICSSRCEKKATLGEEILLENNPQIRFSLSLKKPIKNSVKVRLIRSGELIKTFSGPLPMEIDFEDKYIRPGRKIYYRIDVRGHGALVTNPIFVTFK